MSEKPRSMAEINRERYGIPRHNVPSGHTERRTPRTGPSLRDYLRAAAETAPHATSPRPPR